MVVETRPHQENLSEHSKLPTNSTHIWPCAGIEPGATLVEDEFSAWDYQGHLVIGSNRYQPTRHHKLRELLRFSNEHFG